jgi:hypothetical protein
MRTFTTFDRVKRAERGLIWALVHEPQEAITALKILQDNDLDGLPTRRILEEGRKLPDAASILLPSALFERLSVMEAQLVTRIAAEPTAPWPAMSCSRELQQLRAQREFSELQQEITRLQESGGTPDVELLRKKLDLARELELLSRTVH